MGINMSRVQVPVQFLANQMLKKLHAHRDLSPFGPRGPFRIRTIRTGRSICALLHHLSSSRWINVGIPMLHLGKLRHREAMGA